MMCPHHWWADSWAAMANGTSLPGCGLARKPTPSEKKMLVAFPRAYSA
jgi:hypothetical protein